MDSVFQTIELHTTGGLLAGLVRGVVACNEIKATTAFGIFIKFEERPGSKPWALHAILIMQNRYRTFWPRFLAGIIDALILFPLTFPGLFWDMTNVRTIITVDIAYLFIYSIYVIIGHGIYGHTVGKKVMKVRLLDLSENSTIGIFRAFLRESVWIVLSIVALIDFSIRTKGTAYITLEQSEQLSYYNWITFGWLFLEIITMLTNNKRRALHDFIARSVVIRVSKKFQP